MGKNRDKKMHEYSISLFSYFPKEERFKTVAQSEIPSILWVLFIDSVSFSLLFLTIRSCLYCQTKLVYYKSKIKEKYVS